MKSKRVTENLHSWPLYACFSAVFDSLSLVLSLCRFWHLMKLKLICESLLVKLDKHYTIVLSLCRFWHLMKLKLICESLLVKLDKHYTIVLSLCRFWGIKRKETDYIFIHQSCGLSLRYNMFHSMLTDQIHHQSIW